MLAGEVHVAPADDVQATSRWTRRDTRAVLIIGAISLVAIALFTQAYPRFSPIDEFQHVDYAIKAGRFEIVPEGDWIGEMAKRQFACLGVDSPEYPPLDCSARDLDPEYFPDRGYNTAALQLPIYYTITGVVGRVVDDVLPAGILTSLRLTGALWLTAALALTWAIAGELGVSRRQRALAIALFAPATQLLFTSGTVNADNGLMVGGGLVVLAVLRAERGALSWWWALAAAVAAVALEPTAGLAVGAACLYLLVRAAGATDREDRVALARRTGALAVTGVGAVLFLDLVRDALIGGSVPPNLARYGQLFTPRLSGSQIVGNVFSILTPISSPYVPAFLRGDLRAILDAVTAFALIAMLVGAVVLARRSRAAALGGTLLASMIFAGPLLVLYLYVHSDVYFDIPARYGLALMPAAIATAAVLMRHRAVQYAAGAIAAAHGLFVAVLLVANA